MSRSYTKHYTTNTTRSGKYFRQHANSVLRAKVKAQLKALNTDNVDNPVLPILREVSCIYDNPNCGQVHRSQVNKWHWLSVEKRAKFFRR